MKLELDDRFYYILVVATGMLGVVVVVWIIGTVWEWLSP